MVLGCPQILFVTSLVLQSFGVHTIKPTVVTAIRLDHPLGSSTSSHTGPSNSTKPSPIRPLLLPSPLLIGNYSAVTPTHRVVWWMVEADVDVFESRAYAASS